MGVLFLQVLFTTSDSRSPNAHHVLLGEAGTEMVHLEIDNETTRSHGHGTCWFVVVGGTKKTHTKKKWRNLLCFNVF